MSTNAKILWGEGLFLRPQHFQRQDAYHEQRLSQFARALHPYSWGLQSLTVDLDALSNGILRITEISAVFPDGEIYSAPNVDEPPPPYALSDQEAGSQLTIMLALPLMKEVGGNYESSTTNETEVRFRSQNSETLDMFTNAATSDLTYLKKNVKLVTATEPRDHLSTIPLLKVRRNTNSEYELEKDFIPPSLSVKASSALEELLTRLLDVLQAKISALYGFHRQPSQHIIEFRSGDVASFWLLHTANTAHAALTHLLKHPQLHPERLFHELLRLAGALMTFSKQYTLADLPVYQHEAPHQPFMKLDQILRDQLETVISTKYFSIILQETKPSFHTGRLDSGKIDDKTSLYLAVSAALPAAKLEEIVPVRFKVGAPDDVDKLVLSAMPGVGLTYTPQIPPAIPVRPGTNYFVLQNSGHLFERMLKAQNIAIYAPTSIPDLKLELIAVTQ